MKYIIIALIFISVHCDARRRRARIVYYWTAHENATHWAGKDEGVEFEDRQTDGYSFSAPEFDETNPRIIIEFWNGKCPSNSFYWTDDLTGSWTYLGSSRLSAYSKSNVVIIFDHKAELAGRIRESNCGFFRGAYGSDNRSVNSKIYKVDLSGL